MTDLIAYVESAMLTQALTRSSPHLRARHRRDAHPDDGGGAAPCGAVEGAEADPLIASSTAT